MAPETIVTTADTPVRAGASGPAAPATTRSPRAGYRVQALYEEQELPDEPEADDGEVPEEPEAGHGALLEFQEPEYPEPAGTREASLQRQTGAARVQALLDEALRLGQQYGLIQRHPDGTLLLPGQVKPQQRRTSDCTCPRCTPHHQQHWWCIICNSGPHDWHLVKPQFERQELNAGGRDGRRLAACSAQCARDFLAGIGRQVSGQPATDREGPLDPSLALPG